MKPERSLRADRLLADLPAANASAAATVSCAGVERDDDLDELHHRHGREEVQADHPLGALSVRAASSAIGIDDVFDARNCASGSGSSSCANSSPLTRAILEHRLDHRVGAGQIVQHGRVGDPRDQRLGVVLG